MAFASQWRCWQWLACLLRLMLACSVGFLVEVAMLPADRPDTARAVREVIQPAVRAMATRLARQAIREAMLPVRRLVIRPVPDRK